MNGSLAKRYAKALINVAGKKGQYREFLNDLENALPVFNEDSVLSQFFHVPGVLLEKKKLVLESVILKLKINPEVANLIRVLFDKKRMPIFDELVLVFRRLADVELGQVRVTVTTVKENPDQVQAVQDLLQNHLLQNIIVEEKIDPEILGGLFIRVDDVVFDGSLKAQLEQLKHNIEDLSV